MKDIFDNINIEFSDEILAAADEAIRMHRRMKLTTDIIFKMFFCGKHQPFTSVMCIGINAIYRQKKKPRASLSFLTRGLQLRRCHTSPYREKALIMIDLF